MAGHDADRLAVGGGQKCIVVDQRNPSGLYRLLGADQAERRSQEIKNRIGEFGPTGKDLVDQGALVDDTDKLTHHHGGCCAEHREVGDAARGHQLDGILYGGRRPHVGEFWKFGGIAPECIGDGRATGTCGETVRLHPALIEDLAEVATTAIRQ